MSKIDRLRVMGIRSFGPEESDFQEIRFFSPLTLIVGPNGTGKTTIIECLKYITTGDIPPGAKGAFVHDPKVAHETMVKGQVKLQLKDVTGKVVQVVRSLEATQKAKNVSTKTLDAVITRFKPDGEKVSITSRCADFEREMITALGVSKPVLDSVIFCHQEDSCWPLSEGRQLKDRFDAIFASTRYSKVLDSIRKLKQDHEASVKIFKEELKHLKVQKDEAVRLESDLVEHQAKYEVVKAAVKRNDEDLQPIREKLMDMTRRLNEIMDVQTKIEKLKSRKAQIEKSMQSLQDNIENEFQGNTEDLEKLLSEFANKVKEYRESLAELEKRSKQLVQQLDVLKKENVTLLVDVGRLEREAETHQDNIQRRDTALRNLASNYGFLGFEKGTITDEMYKTFLEEVQKKLNVMNEAVQKLKSDYEEKEKAIQHKIDMVREKKTQLEQTQKFKKDQMDTNKTEIRQIKQRLSCMEASKGRLDHLLEEINKAEQNLVEAESSVNLADLKKEILQLDKDRRQLELQKNEVDEEMTRINMQSSARAKLDMLKKSKTEKEDQIRRLKAKHEDSLKHLLGAVPTEDVRRCLDDYISKQSSSTRKISAELLKAKTQLSQKDAEKNHLSKQIKEKENQARGLEERIESVCGSQNYEEGIRNVEENLSKAQNTRGSLVGAEHFFNKYKSELTREDPCCPLCHRGFETAQEVRELVLELEKKLRLVPQKLQEAETDLKAQQERHNSMIQLKPIREQVADITEKDLPGLRSRLLDVTEEVQKLKQLIKEKEDELLLMESDEASAKDMQPDIVLIDRYQGEVSDLNRKITEQMRDLQGADFDRSLDVVIREKQELQRKLEIVRSDHESKQKKQSLFENRVQSLRSQINDLQRERLNIDADLQQKAKLEETQAKLTSDNSAYELEIQEAVEKLYPLEGEIRKLHREKNEVTTEKEAAVDKDKAAIEEVRKRADAIKDITKTINAYKQSDKQDRLVRKRRRQQEISSEQAILDTDQTEVTANIKKMNEILANQQIRERELSDNLELRKQQEEVDKLNQQISDLDKQLGGLDLHNLERERQKLLKKDEQVETERQRNRMRMQEHEVVIKTKKDSLDGPVFRDANKKYREKMIDLRTTELANSDLEKYYKAMDRAIMNYHAQKMTEINTIIRELWRNTYRGNDIDTIEIRSDNDESGIMKARRTYNYRVVMVKGDTDLDMRGRCSAGQKVLASLIIRLALAETFCMNCGVIALDEPTTNLDSDNIESLAAALVRIIETRRTQRGFQLIVITHDESFVEKLGRSDLSEYYWGVFKDPNGISRVKRIPIQDLERRN